MTRFETGQKVVITDKEHPLYGLNGIVKRCRIQDVGAWVDIEGDLPEKLRYFTADDSNGRGNYFILYPEDCEAVE